MYSDADRAALHVRSADEAYHLGASPAAQSYLDQARVIDLARRVGADAVHPGYGFLSENADFAQGCLDAGLLFVGPPAAAIRAMGSKSASKAAMAAAGVPVAPGYHGEEQSLERLCAEAGRVGFPLIIKASAGGGGKGMQVVRSAGEVAAAVESAQRLARTAFGNDRLLLERYFPTARHVEVQVFADSHGAIVALFDRDCSVQRRHQKIIEEAPAPGLAEEVRAAMAQAAITAAHAVGYVGAGTIEFLVDPEQRFYFMEMNTRLQVEHPVTELITGIDLVEWQLRIASGERLPLESSKITRGGAAIEARLYAEDPAHDYLPSVGRIAHLRWPRACDGLRLDVGVEEGDEVSSFYDPMLGKLIAWGPSRAQAGARAAAGSRRARDRRRRHQSSVASERACRSRISRAGRWRPIFSPAGMPSSSSASPRPSPWTTRSRVCGARPPSADPGALWSDTSGWRLAAPPVTRWTFGEATVTLEMSGPAGYRAQVGGEELALRLIARQSDRLEAEVSGRIERLAVAASGRNLELFRSGRHVRLRVGHTEDSLQASGEADAGSLVTPLPGTVVAVHVAPGQTVARGAPLITLEAMKMEHTVSAPYAGTVERLPFGLSDRVAAGSVLVELKASGA